MSFLWTTQSTITCFTASLACKASVDRIRKACKDGDLPSTIQNKPRSGTTRRIKPEDLIAWCEKNNIEYWPEEEIYQP